MMYLVIYDDLFILIKCALFYIQLHSLFHLQIVTPIEGIEVGHRT
jgi:hypothetical protein